MIYKKSGIGILIFLCVAYQLGLKKILVCLAMMVVGIFAADYTMKTDFLLPCWYSITKKKQANNKPSFNSPSFISHRRSSSSSSIQSQCSIESNSKQKKFKAKINAQLLVKEMDFETYFRLNHPWQSVYIPKNVEKACEEVKKIKKNNQF